MEQKSEMQSKYDNHIGKNGINDPQISINVEMSNFTSNCENIYYM